MNRIHFTGSRAVVSTLLAAGVTLSLGLVQPPPGEGEGRPMPGGREGRPFGERLGQLSPEQLRESIKRRLEDLTKRRDALEQLSKDADAGADHATLMRRFLELRGEGRGPREDGPPSPGDPEGRGPGGPPPGNAEGGRQRGPQFQGDPFGARFEVPRLHGPALSPEDRARVTQELTTYAPELAAKINRLRERKAEAADRVLDGIAANLKPALAMREQNREMFDLRVRELSGVLDIMEAAKKCIDARRDTAPEADLAAARAELRAAMSRQFDLRMDLVRNQVTQLRTHADKLSADLDKAVADREKVIDDKTEQVLKSPGPREPKGGAPRPEGR